MKIFQNIKEWVKETTKLALNSGLPAVVGVFSMFIATMLSQSVVIAVSIVKAVMGYHLVAIQVAIFGGLLSVLVGIVVGCLLGWITSCIVHLVDKVRN